MTDDVDELRILVVAPFGRDAEALRELLEQKGLPVRVCADLGHCSRELAAGAGALLVTEEGLGTAAAAELLDALDRQPSWSALPAVVLATGDASHRLELLNRLGLAKGAVTLLDRPVSQANLISVLNVALATRRRQYEVRELLRERGRRERVLREQAAELRASESRFRELADTAPAMLWVTDETNHCVFLSRGWYEHTGEAPPNGLGLGWSEAVHPDDRARARQTFLQAAARRASFQHEYRLRHVDGGYRWVLDSARPRFGPYGALRGYIGSLIDVHERRTAEREKQRSHALLDAVLESLPVGVVIADADGRLLRSNAAHAALWGLPGSAPDQAPETGWKGWWPGTDRPVRPDEWPLAQALLERHGVAGRLVEIEPGDGSGRRFSMNASAPVFDEAGTLIAGVMAQTDVTDVVRMERALRESEERFRTLADNIDQFAWIADATGAIFWYNRRWFDYTGTTPEEMQGWGWRKVHHPDHVDRVVEKLNRCFRAGEPWEDVFPLRAADGSYRWFLSRMQPLRDADGRITRWLGTNTDVTEQREAQQALREADRRKDEFLATLAHELRNPLAPIRTSVELLRLQGPADEVVRRCRDIIDRQVSDLTRLVDDLLEASRITRGKLDLQKARVALREVLNRAVEAAEPGMTAGQHNFETALPEQDLWLTADATRLAQVFTNLLNNATRYTPPGGRIRLEAVVDDDAVRVTVRDTGIGIRPEHLPRIFEMFSQVTPALERTGGGLGIGLALARGLVELHGGTISAESPGEGRGSAFTVALPRCPAPAEPAGSSPSAEQPAAGRRILVVDDNRDAADGLVQILELMGHDVCAAYSGPEALELAERVQPDVMLLDIGLPGLNGYEVAARIRAADWGSRVILVAQTGWGQRQDKERARAAGFDHHLTKPVDPERLRELLANGHERPATGGR